MATFPRLASPAVLSPMAGVTDVAFRALCKRYGAGMTYTEFVSSTALVRGSDRTQRMVVTDPLEKPVAVQLFGYAQEDVVAAAKMLASQFDVIDINCGCPAYKVVKIGAGSELMKDPAGIGLLIASLVAAVHVPVTLKIRLGIHDGLRNAVEVARNAEKNGAAAVAVHGRTQAQGYRGEADWDAIAQVKKAVRIPVIGNGDVTTPEDFKRRLDESGVDAIMIARGAIGRPFLFQQINDYLQTGRYEQHDSRKDFFAYATLAHQYELPFAAIKQHALSFTKGVVGGAQLRLQLTRCTSVDELMRLLA